MNQPYGQALKSVNSPCRVLTIGQVRRRGRLGARRDGLGHTGLDQLAPPGIVGQGVRQLQLAGDERDPSPRSADLVAGLDAAPQRERAADEGADPRISSTSEACSEAIW